MRIANGKVFDGQCFRERDVVVEGQTFSHIEASGVVECDGPEAADMVDASGCYVIPGLIDVHFHGAVGHDFCDASDEGISAIAAYEASRGVTSICPTTMTLPEERLAPIVASVAAHEVAAGEAGIVGINMEGPFIAPDKVGAQNPAYVRSASLEEFARLQEQAQGLIKLVDVAPEQPGNLEFIRQVSHDVRVSVAHTCTGYDDACAAFDAGARHMTHLFNAMPALHHREPGPIAAGAERNDVTAEIIADGVHIHPAMVRLAFALFGDDRMILISDSLRACGLGDGEYELGGQQFFVKGNRATIANGSLAGSVSDVMACMRTAVRTMGIPLTSAVKATTVNPARALGLDGKLGAIAPGYQADAVVLDRDLNIKHVVLRGKAIA